VEEDKGTKGIKDRKEWVKYEDMKTIVFFDVSTGIFQLLRRNSHIYPL